MPKEFDRIQKGIERSLIEDGIPPKEAKPRSFAIATSQFKEKGKMVKTKTTRKSHTRRLKNGRVVPVRPSVITVNKRRRPVLISKTPVFPIQDPGTGLFLGSTRRRRSTQQR